MRIIFVLLLHSILRLSPILAMELDEQQTVAKILRHGRGEIDINSSWPRSCRPKTDYEYRVKRVRQTVDYPDEILKSWSPEKFTSLSDYKEGEYLSSFRLVVHGLELKHLVQGLEEMSFDDFVHSRLNPIIPLGDDFIPYYPYFFHKKTIISASVICENLTATFGDVGFVLRVPAPNYLFGGNADIHTPTDIDFWKENKLLGVEGSVLVDIKARQFPLPKLDNLLPENKVSTNQGAYAATRTYPTYEEYTQEDNIAEEVVSKFKELGIKNPPPEMVQKALETLGVSSKQLSLKRFQLESSMNKLQVEPDGQIKRTEKKSAYNEIAINPARKLKLLNGWQLLTPKITGVFLRTCEKGLQQFLEKSYVKKLIETAEKFDLPIIFINDGNYYETDL